MLQIKRMRVGQIGTNCYLLEDTDAKICAVVDPGDQPEYMLLGPVDNIHTVKEGDTIDFGGTPIEVLHTPGHSPGSVTYRVGDVLFCGDTLFAGSCGRTDFTGGSYGQILQSLKRLVSLEGNLRVCPGHESTTSLDAERAGNPFVRDALR